jgi:hypothetical protein
MAVQRSDPSPHALHGRIDGGAYDAVTAMAEPPRRPAMTDEAAFGSKSGQSLP